MDKVTPNNVASAEECAAAAEELNTQASAMKGAVAELLSLVGSFADSTDITPTHGIRMAPILLNKSRTTASTRDTNSNRHFDAGAHRERALVSATNGNPHEHPESR